MKRLFRPGPIIFFALVIMLAAVFLLLTAGRVNGGSVSGLRLRSETWSGIVTVRGNTYFAPWATLYIAPGAIVRFAKLPDSGGTSWSRSADDAAKRHDDPTGREGYERTHFLLAGRIIAAGRVDRPIVFTSDQARPEYGDWRQLSLASGSRLEFVDLAYAQNGAVAEGYSVVIRYSRLHDSLWSCVDLRSTSAVVANNEIFDCWHRAVGVAVPGPNLIQDNYIHDAAAGLACERGAKPWILENRFEAAPVPEECAAASGNIIEAGGSTTVGGTYGGKLIYPAE